MRPACLRLPFLSVALTLSVALPACKGSGKVDIGDLDSSLSTEPDIYVSPDSIDFGTVEPGEEVTQTLTLANVGGATLSVSSIELAAGVDSFVITTPPLEYAPGASEDITITFTTSEEGSFSDVVLISSDDPDEPLVRVDLSGVAAAGSSDDVDGDGYTVDEDCDDGDADVHPGADEVWYDGVDSDCDGGSDYDADGDGYDSDAWGGDDCDDGEAGATPDGTQTWYDGIDGDCDGWSDFDSDMDGYDAEGAGGTDCADRDSDVSPGVLEIPDNGIDDDCDGEIDEALSTFDADGDGYSEASGDCDDADASMHPGADEAWYDGLDSDCDGASDFDADGDGHDTDMWGGDDCDDGDAAISPDSTETWYDGVDADCDSRSDYDADGDGFDSSDHGGTDCDDSDAGASPGTLEVAGDGIDNDCDGEIDEALSETDADGDGYSEAEGDCNDSDSSVHPGAAETWYDGRDADCAGDSDYDADGDGYDSDAYGGTDCDDSEDAAWPGGEETWYDGIDGDCDGGSDYDADRDGYDSDAWGGRDCDDSTGEVSPSAADTWYDGVDSDCDGASDYDADGDTDDSADYGGDDCDDTDAATSSLADESCDGIDNDCDGEIDEDDAIDAPTWYLDSDGDGYGDPGVSTTSCAQPSGFSASDADCDDSDSAYNPSAVEDDCSDPNDYNCDGSTGYDDADGDGWAACEDCDDGDASISPDADEYCDDIDNDCDGSVDESSAVDASTWYADGDGDGFGDATSSVASCEMPSGYSADDTDCDDDDGGVYPDADEYCDGVDNDCDGAIDESSALDATTWYHDSDGDGYGDASSSAVGCEAPSDYVSNADDCDDSDDTASPAEPEVCDGVDNDCDGTVDEDDAVDATDWYVDSDGDGYGDGTATTSCEAPTGTVDNADDCDDTDAAISPDATEYCDDIDNDCDGRVDESSAADATTWYRDADRDGFGDSGTTVTACDAPSGYVSDATDCDDDASSVNPDADEVCDGVDNDCDALVDDDDDSLDTSTATIWHYDGDDDGYGDPDSTTLEQCDQPAGYVDDATDCDDGDAAIHPAADEYCDGVDNDCDGEIDEADAVDATTWYADADADTYGDPSVSVVSCDAPSGYLADNTDCDDTDPAINPAATEVSYDLVDNNCDGFQDQMTAVDESAWTIIGESTSHEIGYVLLLSGDMNGDGDAELVIGAPYDDIQTTDAGAISVHDIGTAGSPADFTDGYFEATGRERSDWFGWSVTWMDDPDGDGDDELAVGAPGDDSEETDGGAVYIFDIDGRTGTSTGNTVRDGRIYGSRRSGEFGYSVSSGDLDGDGEADLAIGAPGRNNDEGGVYVFFERDGYETSDSTSGDAEFRAEGPNENDRLGTAVLMSADLTGDGDDDLLACAAGYTGGDSAGACWLVEWDWDFRGSDGSISRYDQAVITSSTDGDVLGYGPMSITAGDIDDDSQADLIIGAPGYDGDNGSVFVFYGGTISGSLDETDADEIISGDGLAGLSVSSGGDVDGDGVEDILIGAPDAGASGEGVVYLFSGGQGAGSYLLAGDETASWSGEASGDSFGFAAAGLVDLDGDGTDDWAAAAPGNDEGGTDAGKVYVLPGY